MFPFTNWWADKEHEWVDTGLIKTWCKHCNQDGYWKMGRVITDNKMCYGPRAKQEVSPYDDEMEDLFKRVDSIFSD